ncbi:MAG: peptidylprolyl isomerase [Rubellimicrobium sp.]|nr:peptidylprolyl isomerase [Rubellimicrobium sp.]
MLRQLLLATTAILAVSGPALAQEAAADITRDSVVASVNGTEITLGELIAAAARLPAEYRQLPPDVLFDGMVSQLIQQQLLADTIEDAPPRVGIALVNEERSLLAGEAVNALLAGVVTDEAIQAAYDERFNESTAQVEYDADHILVATEAEAQAVVERLNAGEDFADLARELSTDTGSGANGGDLGWFTPNMMVEPFSNAVVAMEPGTVSEPVQSQFGWHVIKLNESRPQALPPLETVRPQIESELQEAAITARIEELETGADITRPEAGAFDPASIYNLDLLNN